MQDAKQDDGQIASKPLQFSADGYECFYNPLIHFNSTHLYSTNAAQAQNLHFL